MPINELSLTLGAFLLADVMSFIYLAKRRNVTLWDAGIFIAPFALWYALAVIGLRPKTLSNLVELLALVPVVSVVFVIRVFVGKQIPVHRRAKVAFIVACVFAILVYALVPTLPE
jgi:hypothetical protein